VAPALGPVELRLAVRRTEGGLEIVLRNTEPDFDPRTARPSPGEGLGLANTRARLQRMYGHAASLACAAPAPGVFQATVRIPLREGADADA
jgi:LytS/YehU family sensor histidine kinase